MAFKVSKLQMPHGLLARLVFMFALAVAVVISLVQIISDDDDAMEIFPESTDDCCDVCAASARRFFPGRFLKPVTFYPFPLAEPPSSCTDLTASIFRELRDGNILNSGARALCVGAKSSSDVSVLQELGFKDALAVGPHSFSSLARRGLADKIIAFQDDSFDFAFSRSFDRAAVPALLVLEMERVLKPGGYGVVLVPSMSCFSTMKLAAATISSFLKSSSIAHVSKVGVFTLVAFKKQAAAAAASSSSSSYDDDTEHSNELYHHTGNCRSVVNNRDFMGSLEPLDREKSKSAGARRGFSYLPELMDISARERLMFIEIGAGPFANSSIANWFLPLYPAKTRAFDIFAVDGNVSLGTSYAGRPGITFVHCPGLSEQHALLPSESGPLPDEEAFDMTDSLGWFNKTAARGDFVVLKMNAGGRTALALLRKLLKDGGLCLVDELFLHCPDPKSSRDDTQLEDCLCFLEALRNSGIFAHLW